MAENRPEQPLWSYLDRCDIEFRKSEAALVEKYGYRNCGWTDNLNYCELTRSNFIEGLAHPIVSQFQPGFDLSAPPMSLMAFVRKSDDFMANFELAATQLEAIFGAGQDASASNTKSKRWEFGGAFIDATVFPPSLNKGMGHNPRHSKVPGSKTECSIDIEPRYCFPPSAVEQAWIDTYERFFVPPPNYGPHSGFYYLGRLSRDVQTNTDYVNGEFGFSADMNALIAWYEGRYAEILPIAWIDQIHYTRMTPARSGGGASISVQYTNPTVPPGLQKTEPGHLTLASKYGDPEGMDSTARRLAAKLEMRLIQSEYPDC